MAVVLDPERAHEAPQVGGEGDDGELRRAGRRETAPGRLYNTQWTQVPAGASGSSAMSAKVPVPAGALLQASGGDTSAPSHVCLMGIAAPSLKAVLESENAMVASRAPVIKRVVARIRR